MRPLSGRSLLPALRRFWNDRDSGQAAVEFAIAFPIQLFITFGLMQLVLIAIACLMVNYASFASARAALVGEDPARAALLVLAPLAGITQAPASDDSASRFFGDGLYIPGWGTLHGSARAVDKIHVRVNDTSRPFQPAPSRFTITDPYAYEDSLRFAPEALDARERIAEALGDSLDVRIVVEFDFELIFPVVDIIFAAALRPHAGLGGDETAFGRLDANASGGGSYAWAYIPGKGYNGGRIRLLNGARHLIIARECSLYRGYVME